MDEKNLQAASPKMDIEKEIENFITWLTLNFTKPEQNRFLITVISNLNSQRKGEIEELEENLRYKSDAAKDFIAMLSNFKH